MRFWENDKASKKNTLVVIIGLSNARKYDFLIIITAILITVLFVVQKDFKLVNLLFIFIYIPFVLHLRKVFKTNHALGYDSEIKKVVRCIFLFSILFWISLAL